MVGLIWSLGPAQDADASFRPRVAERAFRTPMAARRNRSRPGNVHTGDGRFAPFARLMSAMISACCPAKGRITIETLRNTKFRHGQRSWLRGLAQQLANTAGLERVIHFAVDAFADDEIATLVSWVSNGGRALVADHTPAAEGSRRLAAASVWR